jgi:hypothetical protein
MLRLTANVVYLYLVRNDSVARIYNIRVLCVHASHCMLHRADERGILA